MWATVSSASLAPPYENRARVRHATEKKWSIRALTHKWLSEWLFFFDGFEKVSVRPISLIHKKIRRQKVISGEWRRFHSSVFIYWQKTFVRSILKFANKVQTWIKVSKQTKRTHIFASLFSCFCYFIPLLKTSSCFEQVHKFIMKRW